MARKPAMCGKACQCDRAQNRAEWARWDAASDLVAELDRGWRSLRDTDIEAYTDACLLEGALAGAREDARDHLHATARMKGIKDVDAYVAKGMRRLG